jgi:hypothetical protein
MVDIPTAVSVATLGAVVLSVSVVLYMTVRVVINVTVIFALDGLGSVERAVV